MTEELPRYQVRDDGSLEQIRCSNCARLPTRTAVTSMQEVAMPEEPQLERVRGGWAAHGHGWAVHAPSREEAVRRYGEALERHREIDRRPLPTEQ